MYDIYVYTHMNLINFVINYNHMNLINRHH